MSYLNIGTGKSSPLLTFARAALLGASNRGDPYSCIINYSKCPKDQSRLLYYLNNHRGGFFQYFDKKDHRPGNYYYQNQYNPNYQYQNYYNKYKTNKIIFENSKDFIGQLKKKGTGNGVYAKKYTYSSFKFPKNNEESLSRRPMVFPEDRSEANNVPRILSNSPTASSKRKVKFLDGSSRFSKKLKDLNFFPDEEETTRLSNSFVSDRLPPKFHFPLNEDIDSFTKQPTENSFFPPN